MHGLLVLSLLLVTNPAPSGYNIGLYADVAGTECALTEVLYVTNTIYVVFNGGSAKSAELRVVNNWPSPLLGPIDWAPNPFLGDPYTGIYVSFGGCKSGPYLLGTLSFIPISATPKCAATLEVVASSSDPYATVEVVDCDDQVQAAVGRILYINGGWYIADDGSKSCDCFSDPIATEPTTWGRIKSLYQ